MFPSRRPGRRLFPATDDAGLSLAELLVSMVITSIVFILGATMLTTTLPRSTLFGSRTATGTLLLPVALLLPSWPDALLPQAASVPSAQSATL